MGVVVVTHRSAADVTNALTALPTSELARVIVVDNDSPDNTVAVIQELALANVEVFQQANLGFGAGNDAGRARLPAAAEFVLFLNPDCVIQPSDLERLVAYLDSNDRCGLVGPQLRNAAEPMTAGGSLPTLRSELQPLLPRALGRFVSRRQLAPTAMRSGSVGYVEGACMLARVRAFDAVGGFDHRYFLCFEEMDLARRLTDAGWTVELCSDAWATHAGKGSRAQAPLFSIFHQYRSQRLYLERWHGRRVARRYVRIARIAWWARRAAKRITPAEHRVLIAAVTGAEFPK